MSIALNIDTLLEAATFLEQRKEESGPRKTRDGTQFHGYAKSEQGANEGDNESPSSIKRSRSDSSSEENGRDCKRRAGGAGTREVHNKLEKNRRAHLKECFDNLKKQIPSLADKKTSNLSILRSSLRYIQMLKRKEKEYEQETIRLAQAKAASQDRIAQLKKDLAQMNVEIDLNNFIKNDDSDAHSDSTATADEENPIMSDNEDEHESKSGRSATIPRSFLGAHVAPQPVSVTSMITLTTDIGSRFVLHNGPWASSPMVTLPSTTQNNLIPRMVATTLPAASNKVSLNSAGQSYVPSLMPPPKHAPLVTSIARTTTPVTTTTQTFKTPVTQILQQTLAHRAWQQQQQQQQQKLAQQQPPQQNGTQQVITVQPSQLRPVANTQLRSTTMAATQLRGTTMAATQLRGTTMAATQLRSTTVAATQLRATTMAAAQLRGTTMATTQLHGTTMAATQLHGTTMDATQLHGTTMAATQLHGTTMAATQLHGTTMAATQLHGTTMAATQLHGTTMAATQLRGTTVAINHLGVPQLVQGTSILATPTGLAPQGGQGSVSQASTLAALAAPVSGSQAGTLAALGKMATSSGTSGTSPASPTTTGVQNVTPLASLKHFITTPISPAQLVSPALGQLMKTQQISSLNQVSPGTQYLPMTMMSPGLSQVVNGQQVNKLIGQIPILQQPFGLSHVVRPFVMVTMPNVAVTTSSPVQVTVPVTNT